MKEGRESRSIKRDKREHQKSQLSAWQGSLATDGASLDDYRRSISLFDIFFSKEKRILLDMRDAVMTSRIRKLVQVMAAEDCKKDALSGSASESGLEGRCRVILAVVGKPHVLGISRMWKERVENERFSQAERVAAPSLAEYADAIPDLLNNDTTEESSATATATATLDNPRQTSHSPMKKFQYVDM